MHYYETLPQFFMYFLTTVVMALAFIGTYILITPHKELQLIKDGNTAAAIQLIGTFIGFALPLAQVVTHSANLLDVLLWGVVAFVVQIVTFLLVSFMFEDISLKLKDNNVGCGIFLGGLSLGIGVLQAACMVP